MHDDLERVERLLREVRRRSATATLAAALRVDESEFPTGARGARLMERAREAAGLTRVARATVVVRVIGQVIEALTGGLSPAVQVRGGSQEGVLIRQQLGEHEVTTHLDVDDGFVVTLDLGVDAAARGVRVTLFAMAAQEREVASDAVTQGRLRLPRLAAGLWQVRLRDAAGWSALLDLDLAYREA